MRHLNILSLFIVLFFAKNSNGQDIHFSQIFETPIMRNPALAGIFTGDTRLQTVYRSQWNNITDAYQTVSMSGEFRKQVGYTNDYVTFGAQVLYDRAGTIALTATHVLPAINYHKSLNDERNMYLSAGIMGGFVQRSFDQGKMTTNNQYGGAINPGVNTGENFAKSSYHYFDGSVGMSFNTQIGENADNNLYIAGAYHHFNKPKSLSFFSNTAYEMKPRWVGSFGFTKMVNEYSNISLQADYNQQGAYREIIAGALISRKLDDIDNPSKIIYIGGYFRWQDAFIPAIKIEFKPISIGVSYDANISALKKVSMGRGGFEISLAYKKAKEQSVDPDVRCPKF